MLSAVVFAAGVYYYVCVRVKLLAIAVVVVVVVVIAAAAAAAVGLVVFNLIIEVICPFHRKSHVLIFSVSSLMTHCDFRKHCCGQADRRSVSGGNERWLFPMVQLSVARHTAISLLLLLLLLLRSSDCTSPVLVGSTSHC